ncbi:hypothetical protein AB0K14_24420 [Actinosynnema sp. NPDC050801]|uniref:hypothetical protein n=1 Tax=unclassified Actinosynnema TaxID=2637065 RepID=UPI0033F0EA09
MNVGDARSSGRARLRHGENTVEFVVEQNAPSPNGLAIHGNAIAPDHTDEHITLRGG